MSKKMMILMMLIMISSILFGAEKYAVLITGEYADSTRANYNGSWAVANNRTRDLPMQEFWNDTFLMWEMLVLEKGYDDENVFILFAGGIDYPIDPDANCPAWWDVRYSPQQLYPELFPYPGDQITDYSATKENVVMVFNGLAYGNQQENIPQLQSDEYLPSATWIILGFKLSE